MTYKSKDLESIERYVRIKSLQIGNKTITMLLQDHANRIDKQEVTNKALRLFSKRSKQFHTLLGTITINRGYYYGKDSGEYQFPFDKQYGLEASSYSLGVQRSVSKLGAYLPFGFSDSELLDLTGINFGTKAVERLTKEVGAKVLKYNIETDKKMPVSRSESGGIMYMSMDGTGIPMTNAELLGRPGKQTQQAKTREVKLGCIFTQTTTDASNYPIREESSTTYVGGILTAKELGSRIEQEAEVRKIAGYRRCIIGDGAAWIWNIADELFPDAIQIVDLYHAREHYWNIARLFFGENSPKLWKWTKTRKKQLDAGNVKAVIAAIANLKPKSEEQKKYQRIEIGYFTKHKKRMQYHVFRKRGLFVGSGVLEAGCKTLIGQRLKQSGMHWSFNGAQEIIALRCCIFSNQWEDFWEKRAAA